MSMKPLSFVALQRLAAAILMGGALAVAAGPSQAQDRTATDTGALPTVLRSDREKSMILRGQVGIVTGQPTGVYARLGSDMVRLLNDRKGSTLRVAAVTGHGSISNIDDLLHLGGIDFAILQSDVLQAYRATPTGEELGRRLRYVSRLHTEYLHVLTRQEVIGGRAADVCVLAGKRINVGGQLSGTWLTVRSVLQGLLGLDLAFDASTSTDEGIEQLKAGKVDAVAFVVGKPAPLFAKLSAKEIVENKLELLAIGPELFTKGCDGRAPAGGLDRTPYELGTFSADDYVEFVPAGRSLPTIGVPSVLAAYAWAGGAPRFEPTAAFVRNFFERAPEAMSKEGNGFATNWCGVDLGREVGGWERMIAAQDWIRANPGRSLRIECRKARLPLCDDKTMFNTAFEDWLGQQPGPRPSVREIMRKSDEFRAQQCGS
ncbi:TAXI family TRAP transporter solute-binding subunit [Azospirillum largimobile]